MNNFRDMTPEQRAEYGRQGGIKSGESKRNKKAMREMLEVLLDMPMKKGKCYTVDDIKSFADFKGKNIKVETAILLAQLQRALKGDLASAEFIRDTSGQKPKDSLNIQGSIPVVISGEAELED